MAASDMENIIQVGNIWIGLFLAQNDRTENSVTVKKAINFSKY